MSQPPHIRYLCRAEINIAAWNACIEGAANGQPYAHTFFLDAMCPQWSGLVQDDYAAVMPLPYRKKWGVHYLYQPFLVPFLGVFCKTEGEIDADPFLKKIPPCYRLWDLSFNAANKTKAYSKWAIERTNYLLSLPDYALVKKAYHQSVGRNLQKAAKAGLTIQTGIPVTQITGMAALQYPRFTKVTDSAFDPVQAACTNFPHNIFSYGVYQNEHLIAGCVLIRFRNNIIYWLPANSPKSRTCGASHFLMDRIIQDFSGQDMVLDFEGSDDAGVALFYQRFGAAPQLYYSLYYNRLFFPASLLKRLPAHYRHIIANKQKRIL